MCGLTDKNYIIKTNLDKTTVFYYKNIFPYKMLNISLVKDHHRGQKWKGKQQNALNYGFCEKYLFLTTVSPTELFH